MSIENLREIGKNLWTADVNGEEVTIAIKDGDDPESIFRESMHDNLTYKEKRAAAYPSIPDQLDLLYHLGYDGWKEAVDLIKAEFPKE